MIATIIAKRIEKEPPDSHVIPTCDVRLLIIDFKQMRKQDIATLQAIKKVSKTVSYHHDAPIEQRPEYVLGYIGAIVERALLREKDKNEQPSRTI